MQNEKGVVAVTEDTSIPQYVSVRTVRTSSKMVVVVSRASREGVQRPTDLFSQPVFGCVLQLCMKKTSGAKREPSSRCFFHVVTTVKYPFFIKRR